MKFKFFISILILAIVWACSSSHKINNNGKMEDYFFVRKADESSPISKWLIILPGSDGLKIFDDAHHYFDLADELNKEGYSVLLVDYVAAYKASQRNMDESTGEKIVWVTEQTIKWGINEQIINPKIKGSIIGWSLAGEGIILLANDEKKIEQLHIESIALYYPSNKAKVKLKSDLPILVQSGDKDLVANQREIRQYYEGNTNTQIITYGNAHHGFDVASLIEERTLRFPPIVGKKYTFAYNENAHKASLQKLIAFLTTDNSLKE